MSNTPGHYNLRSKKGNSLNDSKDGKSSPRSRKSSPRSPNASGNSSSHSNRDRSRHLDYYDDNDWTGSESQDDDEDDFDNSYPSTTFSPSAATPSPKQIRHRQKGVNTSGSDTSPYTPSTSKFSHRAQAPSSDPDSSPDMRKIYPKLPNTTGQENEGHSPNAKENMDKNNTENVKWLTVGVAVVLLVLIVACLTSSDKQILPKLPNSKEFQNFVSEVDKLKTIFQSQESRTWRSIKSSVKHILNGTDPEYPAVVMFAVRKDIGSTGSCLARRVASLFNSVSAGISGHGYIDAKSMNHLEAGKQKEDLDEKINSHLNAGRSIVIDHLEELAPRASLLLHGTCDNDNAPFKNVFIGIVFNVDKNLKATDVDNELTSYFLKELDMDKIGALLTRINNNAVVVRDEDQLTDEDLTQCS